MEQTEIFKSLSVESLNDAIQILLTNSGNENKKKASKNPIGESVYLMCKRVYYKFFQQHLSPHGFLVSFALKLNQKEIPPIVVMDAKTRREIRHCKVKPSTFTYTRGSDSKAIDEIIAQLESNE
jgi:hypothetical protein